MKDATVLEQSAKWETVPLTEAAFVGAGNSAPQKKELFKDGRYPFIRTSDVGQIGFGEISEARDLLNDVGIGKLRRVPKGAILMPKSGASTFLNHRVETTVDAYISSHLATIEAREAKSLPRYLLYYLSTVRAQDLIQDHRYPSLTLGIIGNIPVPLPPLEEQKRIVAVLDQAFAALDRARAHAEANLADAEELFPSVLSKAFKPDDLWDLRSIADLVSQSVLERPIDGNHGETHPKKADFVETGVPFIMASDLVEGAVEQSECYFIKRQQADKLRKGFAKNGDVLLSHKGTIGRAAILETDLDYVMLTPQVTYYRILACPH